MKVKELVSAYMDYGSEKTCTYIKVRTSRLYDIAFLAKDFVRVADEVPNVFDAEVDEWSFFNYCAPHGPEDNASTIDITTK